MALCLVTGSTGFVGRHLCRALSAQGHRVVAAGRQRPAGWPADRWRQLDLSESDWPVDLLDGAEHLFHLAAIAHTGAVDARLIDRVNHLSVIDLVDLAAKAGLDSFVFLSSILATRPQDSPYALAKHRAETALANRSQPGSMSLVTLRPALIYGAGAGGNLAWLMRSIAARRLPPPPPDVGRRPMVAVTDVVDALIQAAFSNPPTAEPITLCDGEHYSLRRLVRVLVEARGKTFPRWSLPLPLWRFAGVLGDVLGTVPGLSQLPGRDVVRRMFNDMPMPDGALAGFDWRATSRLEDCAAAMWSAFEAGVEHADG